MNEGGSILFVCTGNTCRSPMAQAIATMVIQQRRADQEKMRLISAGIGAVEGQAASVYATQAIGEMGLDLSAHRAKRLTPELVENASRVICMTQAQVELVKTRFPEAAAKVERLGERDILDPFGHDLEVYRQCLFELQAYVIPLVSKLTSTTQRDLFDSD